MYQATRDCLGFGFGGNIVGTLTVKFPGEYGCSSTISSDTELLVAIRAAISDLVMLTTRQLRTSLPRNSPLRHFRDSGLERPRYRLSVPKTLELASHRVSQSKIASLTRRRANIHEITRHGNY